MQNQITKTIKKLIGILLSISFFLFVDFAYANHNDFNQTQKSGSGGFDFTIGKKKQSTDARNTQTTHTGSMVGNLKSGNTNLIAGEKYTQSGSTVNSLGGDVNIAAKQIDVQSVTNTASQDTVHKFKQSGLTVSLSVPVVDTVTGLASSAKTMSKSKNSRVNAMAAANTAMQGYEAGQAIQDFAKNPKSGISLSISLGSQKSKSESHIKSGEVQASRIQAAGTTNLVATNTESSKPANINVIGSDIAGDKGTNLSADNDIRLMAGTATNSERSSNKSSGGSIGLQISTEKFGVSVSANKGKGYGNGDGTTYRNSHVGSAVSKTTVNTGEKLTLKGAQILGKAAKVTAKDLDIESLQDSSSYKGKQKNVSGSLTVGFTGVSGSANYGKSKINANHQAVAEQSGILVGNDGFQVTVQNHTDLKGGIITSTQKAQNDGTNAFKTGTIATENLQNHSEYNAKGFAVELSASTNDGLGKPLPGYGKDGDSQSSTTVAGVGTENITIEDKNNLLTADDIRTTATTEQVLADSGLQNRFDKDVVQSEIDLQVKVTQKAAKLLPKAVADFASSQTQKYEQAQLAEKVLTHQLNETTDAEKRAELTAQLNHVKAVMQAEQATYDTWKEGGTGRVLLHTAVGGLLTGDASGALGAGSTATLAPQIRQAKENLPEGLKGAFDLVVGGAIGAVAGGKSGAFTGSAVDWNNRQLHPKEMDWIKENSKRFAKEQEITEEQAAERLMQQAAKDTDILWYLTLADKEDNAAKSFLNKQSKKTFVDGDGDKQNFFVAKDNDFWVPREYAKEAYDYNKVNNDHFIENTLQKGIVRRPTQGLKDKASNTFEYVKDHKIETVKGIAKGIKDATIDCVTSPVKCGKDVVKNIWDVGSSTVIESGKNLVLHEQDKIDALYGQSMEAEMAVITGAQALSLVGGGKVIGKGANLGEKGLKAGVKGAVKAGKNLGNLGKLALGKSTSLPNKKIGIQWGKGINNQGKPWESYLQSYLPVGTIDLNTIKPNFKTFDYLLPDGTAISAKTMDTVGSKTYSKANAITRTLNKYVDQMVKFAKDGKGMNIIKAKDISAREMYLAIPAQTTKKQRQAIQKSIDYAKSRGANIIIKEIK